MEDFGFHFEVPGPGRSVEWRGAFPSSPGRKLSLLKKFGIPVAGAARTSSANRSIGGRPPDVSIFNRPHDTLRLNVHARTAGDLELESESNFDSGIEIFYISIHLETYLPKESSKEAIIFLYTIATSLIKFTFRFKPTRGGSKQKCEIWLSLALEHCWVSINVRHHRCRLSRAMWRKSWRISSKSVSSTYFPGYCAPPIQFARWTLLKERLILAVRTGDVEMGALEGRYSRERRTSSSLLVWARRKGPFLRAAGLMARSIFSPCHFFSSPPPSLPRHWLIFVIKATAAAERSVTRCADRLAVRARVKLFDFGDPTRASRPIDRKIGRLSKPPIA